MFDLDEMTRIVRLQAQSYALLRWAGEGVGKNALNFSRVHGAMSAGEAAQEWLARSAPILPKEMHVGDTDLPAFANLFASYLTTSFTLKESPDLVRRSRTGCYCAFCARLEFANALVVRQPDKKAQTRAREMKYLYLTGLAQELGVSTPPADIAALVADPAYHYPLAYATYGHELLRRAAFASQGEGILVLWRTIAWQNNKPNKKFVLSADAILAAESMLVTLLVPPTPEGEHWSTR